MGWFLNRLFRLTKVEGGTVERVIFAHNKKFFEYDDCKDFRSRLHRSSDDVKLASILFPKGRFREMVPPQSCTWATWVRWLIAFMNICRALYMQVPNHTKNMGFLVVRNVPCTLCKISLILRSMSSLPRTF